MIELVEVSPRDGLQNERVALSTSDKVALITKAIDAGVRRLEVTSFVHPKLVPQMADAEAVVDALPRRTDVRAIGLVLNARGVDRALATGIDELGLVVAASDAFGLANQNLDTTQGLAMAEVAIARAREGGRAAHVTLAVAFGCPFSGAVAEGRVVELARRAAQAGSAEVALADTIGVARPDQVERLVRAVAEAVAPVSVRVHLHDTHGMGVANALAAVRAGAATLDGSIGGVGGCPFAPGASGNVATEDLLYALGEEVGVRIAPIVAAGFWLNDRLGRQQSSAQMRAAISKRQDA